MPWRDRRSLDIAGDSQLSRIKTEQAILNLFDRDHLGNRLSVFRDNEFCLSGLHFIHNCQTLRFELSRRDCFQEWHLTMVIIPWSNSFKVCGNYAETRDRRRGQTKQPPMNRNNGAKGVISSVPHRPTSSIFPEPFDAARAGYSGQVPTLRPERLISGPFSPDPKGTQKISMTVP